MGKYYTEKSSTNSVQTPEYVKNIAKKLLYCETLFDPCPFNKNFDKTTDTNGLVINWKHNTFCNPPYSNCGPWLRKARTECERGISSCLLVKVDVLSRKYFSEIGSPCEIHLFSQKVKFLGYKHVPRFCNILLVFKPEIKENRWFHIPRF